MHTSLRPRSFRLLPLLLLVALLLPACATTKTKPVVATAPEPEAPEVPALPADDGTYTRLLEKLKAGDLTIDFTTLRVAYTRTEAYNPYLPPSEERGGLFEALDQNEFLKAIELGRTALDQDYLDIEAHVAMHLAYDALEQKDRAAFHSRVAQGLLRSILASGDGKSPATAFLVIRIAEEYVVVQTMGLRVESQALVQEEGHAYDSLETVHPESGEKQTFFFNIDLPFASLQKAFE